VNSRELTPRAVAPAQVTLAETLRRQRDTLAAELCAGLHVLVVGHEPGPALDDAAASVRRIVPAELSDQAQTSEAIVCLEGLGREARAHVVGALCEAASAGTRVLVALPARPEPPEGGRAPSADLVALLLRSVEGAVVVQQHALEVAWLGDGSAAMAEIQTPEFDAADAAMLVVVAGFAADNVAAASGRAEPAADAVHALHLAALEAANAQLRRANARLASERLGTQDSAAASRLVGRAQLEAELVRAGDRIAGLERLVAGWEEEARKNDSYFQAARRQLQTRRHRYVEAVHHRARSLPVIGRAWQAPPGGAGPAGDPASAEPPAETSGASSAAAQPAARRHEPPPSDATLHRFIVAVDPVRPALAATITHVYRSLFSVDDAVELALGAPGDEATASAVVEEIVRRSSTGDAGPAVVRYDHAALGSLPGDGSMLEGGDGIAAGMGAGVIVARMHEVHEELTGGAMHVQTGIHGTYVGDGRVFVTTTWGGRLFASARDLSITPELLAAGGYDLPFTNFALAELRPGDVVFDVGANIGVFTVLMARIVGPTGRVVAYEPEPANLLLLRDNVAFNYLNEWVEVIGRAAAAESGTVPFFSTQRFKGNASLVAHDDDYLAYFGVDASERIDVETEPLDSHLGSVERIDLLKIDVEGAEYRALVGARELLRSGVVRRVCLEVVRRRMGADWDPFVDLLRELQSTGWHFSRLDERGRRIPLPLNELVDGGWFSQVLLEPPA
jgi:FkbM family methyltransferase